MLYDMIIYFVLVISLVIGSYIIGNISGRRNLLRRLNGKDKELKKQHNIARMYDMWLLARDKGRNIEELLKEDKIRTVAIFGLSMLGFRLWKELEESDIHVVYGIESNERITIPDLKIYRGIYDDIEKPDAVIVTAMTTYDEIKERLYEAGYKNIFCLDELLYRMQS